MRQSIHAIAFLVIYSISSGNASLGANQKVIEYNDENELPKISPEKSLASSQDIINHLQEKINSNPQAHRLKITSLRFPLNDQAFLGTDHISHLILKGSENTTFGQTFTSQNLQKIKLSGIIVNPEFLNFCPRLKVAKFYNCHFESCRPCKANDITSIILSQCTGLGDNFFSAFAKLNKLKLNGMSFTNKALEFVKLKDLKLIHCNYCSDEGLAYLGGEIQSLLLQGIFSGSTLSCLPNLRNLIIHDIKNRLDPLNLKDLPRTLDTLELILNREVGGTNDIIFNLGCLNLKSLSLKLHDREFEGDKLNLSPLKHIEHLEIFFQNYSRSNLPKIYPTHLDSLIIKGCSIKNIEEFSALPSTLSALSIEYWVEIEYKNVIEHVPVDTNQPRPPLSPTGERVWSFTSMDANFKKVQISKAQLDNMQLRLTNASFLEDYFQKKYCTIRHLTLKSLIVEKSILTPRYNL